MSTTPGGKTPQPKGSTSLYAAYAVTYGVGAFVLFVVAVTSQQYGLFVIAIILAWFAYRNAENAKFVYDLKRPSAGGATKRSFQTGDRQGTQPKPASEERTDEERAAYWDAYWKSKGRE
jgi:hypothetical protein